MKTYIQKLEEIGKEEVAAVGGKGANLGEMVRVGISVPDGFVLNTEAYRRFVEVNLLDLSQKPERIREQFLQGKMPEDMQEALENAYRRMGDRMRVAVRSSATAEDLEDASFAGQQETFLNVQGEKELLEAVKACYASLWGDRAVSYRREKGYSDENTALAVVVQQMVESETAGVLFTVNPANGNRDEILVNASYGLGESVVSGAVSPDELICTRDGKCKECRIGEKQTEVVYGEKRTMTVPVEESKRQKCSITEEQVRQLVQEACRIEKHYGMPMDIEWAFAQGKLYILQARAVTAVAQGDDRIREDAMPPLMPVNRKMRNSLMFMLEKEPFAYYPLDFDFSMILGEQKGVIFREAGLNMDNDCKLNEDGFMLLPSVKIGVGRAIVHLPAMLRQMKDHPDNVRHTLQCLDRAEPEIYRMAEQDVSALGLGACREMLEKLYKLITETAYMRFRYAVFPAFAMNRKLEKYLKRVDENLAAYDLLGGLSYKTAEMNRSIRELALVVNSKEQVKKLLLDGADYESLAASDPEVKEALEEFLRNNGYKSDFPDYCFASKTWLEDKERFLHVLRPQVLGCGESGREMTKEEGMAGYRQLVERVTQGLSEKKAGEFCKLAEYYRTYHVQRERTQYLWEVCFYACRKALGRMAQLLGVPRADLLYLRYQELTKALERGELDAEEREKIDRRKVLRPTVEEYWKRQKWEVCKGDGETLHGVSGSAGKAEGRACVVRSPEEFSKLQKGDVLVCPYTDPEWTPLFALAAAVVSDTGGVLSHAAIVAREYRIPAVLAVGNATTALVDGDWVLVDGSKGEVDK